MKILFLTFHGFDPASGITKKMQAQVKGLRQCGHSVALCYYDFDARGHRCRFIDGEVIADYGTGLLAAMRQRTQYGCIYNYCVAKGIELVYVRSYMNASPWLTSLFCRLTRAGVRSVMEIPTYPYDQEFAHFDLSQRLRLRADRLFRHRLARAMTAIVTFSDEERIFGQRTIRISNGVDLDAIPLCDLRNDTSEEVHLIAVAEVHSWHGFDRLLHGLGLYYSTPRKRRVVFHLVGDVWPAEMEGANGTPGFRPLIKEYGLESYVVFHGKLFGKELDEVFDRCSLAIGSLGRHRSGITTIKTLKNREYASRGLPFIYSEQDSDFDGKPYVLRVPADETPIDIEAMLTFLDQQTLAPGDIRSSVAQLSWREQMASVIRQL